MKKFSFAKLQGILSLVENVHRMKKMLKRSIAIGAVALLAACGGGYTGELTGVIGRPICNHIMPFGTVYIPSGQLHIGNSDQDIFGHLWQRQKPISIQGFYMDEMEISNNEYCLLYTSPSPRDQRGSRMPSSA